MSEEPVAAPSSAGPNAGPGSAGPVAAPTNGAPPTSQVEPSRLPAAGIPPEVAEFEQSRGRPLLAAVGALDDECLATLYDFLRERAAGQPVDVLISSWGGTVMTSRRVMQMLHQFCPEVAVWVPRRALSAATLMCMGANELFLGPLAELSPIDCQLGANPSTAGDGPSSISSEDIRAFYQLAEEWFGVDLPEQGGQVLQLLTQRVSPLSLATVYRYDRLVRKVGEEMLAFQLPDRTTEDRRQIVDGLISAYATHEFILTPVDMQQLGLRVSLLGMDEAEQATRVEDALRRQVPQEYDEHGSNVHAVLCGDGFLARYEDIDGAVPGQPGAARWKRRL